MRARVQPLQAAAKPAASWLRFKDVNSPFLLKLTNWEFWPFNVIYLPVFFYYLWLSLKARSFFFFTASNPSIAFGGMLGESKGDVLSLLPSKYLPLTGRFSANARLSEITQWMMAQSLDYPILLKPDIGERGWMVKKINNEEDIAAYLSVIKVPFLAQEYVSLPVELGLFYYRMPTEQRGKISSITRKGLLAVVGNGHDTVEGLLLQNPRARLYIPSLQKQYPEKLAHVPAKGEEVEVEPIGNHCRGTIFFDDTHKVTEKLEQFFDQLTAQIPGFYFGRFDLRCRSYQDLESGINFKILELNGAGAEPGHIYHPGRSLWQGYGDIIFHLNVLFNIAVQNRELGVPYMRFQEGLRFIRKIRAYNRQKAT